MKLCVLEDERDLQLVRLTFLSYLSTAQDSNHLGEPTMFRLTLVFLHLRQNISDNFAVKVFGNPQELRPAQKVVKVVLHLTVFSKNQRVNFARSQV